MNHMRLAGRTIITGRYNGKPLAKKFSLRRPAKTTNGLLSVLTSLPGLKQLAY